MTYPLDLKYNMVLANTNDQVFTGNEMNVLVGPTNHFYYISGGLHWLMDEEGWPPAFCYEHFSSLLGLKIVNDEVDIDLCVAVENVSAFELQDNASNTASNDPWPPGNLSPIRNRVIVDNNGYIFVKRYDNLTFEMYSPNGKFIDSIQLKTEAELRTIFGMESSNYDIGLTKQVAAIDGVISFGGTHQYGFGYLYSYGYTISYTSSGFGSFGNFTSYVSQGDDGNCIFSQTDSTFYYINNTANYTIDISYAKYNGKSFYSTVGGGPYNRGYFGVYDGDYGSGTILWSKQGSYVDDGNVYLAGIVDYNDTIYIIVADCDGVTYFDNFPSLGGAGYRPLKLLCYDIDGNLIWSQTLRDRGSNARMQFELLTADDDGNIYLWYRDKIEKRDLLTYTKIKDITYPPHIVGYCLHSKHSSWTGANIVNPRRILIADTRSLQAWSKVNRVQTNVPYLHVHSIEAVVEESPDKPDWYRVVYYVCVKFDDGSPGANCTVEADFVGTVSGKESATTNGDGIAVFTTGYIRGGHGCKTYLGVLRAYRNGVSLYNYREAENNITEKVVVID